eukprot:TRINITY_DN35837_c0_g1_i1.p1 TRINITY_DN35837_c0_g1~~TRINITY_DN35837_c0_g1_i1.p1  ORF type:complete len:351 (-),score=30.92 TRINITY_DN35837_c0_g1_i1:100-1152(-)
MGATSAGCSRCDPNSTIDNDDAGEYGLRCSSAFDCQEPLPSARILPFVAADRPPYLDKHEDGLSIDRVPFEFSNHDAIPHGWEITAESPPEAFHALGRDACVIKDTTLLTQAVLWVLPSWSIDTVICDWLVNRSSIEDWCGSVCRLNQHVNFPNQNTSVLYFRYPKGVPVNVWTSINGRLGEASAQCLCRDLLLLIMQLQDSPIGLCRALLPSMVFLDESGCLSCILLLGCCMTWRGFKSSVMAVDSARIAPEVSYILNDGGNLSQRKKDSLSCADVFSVATIILEAMTGAPPGDLRQLRVSSDLSKGAIDFFQMTLYKDPEWRLSVDDALLHSWLRPATLTSDSSPRVR